MPQSAFDGCRCQPKRIAVHGLFQRGTSVYDQNWNLITTLGRSPINSPIGMAYSPTGDILYDAEVGASRIDAYNTDTWQRITSYNLGYTFSFATGSGRLRTSDDGAEPPFRSCPARESTRLLFPSLPPSPAYCRCGRTARLRLATAGTASCARRNHAAGARFQRSPGRRVQHAQRADEPSVRHRRRSRQRCRHNHQPPYPWLVFLWSQLLTSTKWEVRT